MGYLDNTGLAYFWGKLQAILANKANTASPALTGTPTAPTATAGTNNTQLATTAFVMEAIASAVEVINTETGKFIQITDAKANSQVKILNLYDSSGNLLTGKSVAVSNKNLFRLDLISSSLTNKGVTFTKNSDGSVTASGTSTGTYASTTCTIDKNAFVAGKIYNLNCGKTTGNLYVQLALTYTDGTTDYFVSRLGMTNFMVPKEVASAVGSVQLTDSGVTINQTVYPQLLYNSQASSSFVLNDYDEITYTGSNLPTLPDTVTNIWSNDDDVATIEVTYVRDTISDLQVANEKISNLESYIADLDSETILVASDSGSGSSSAEEQLAEILEDSY